MRLKLITILLFSMGALAAADDSMDVIVRFKPSADNTGHARFVERGATYKKALELIGSHVYHIQRADYAALAAEPEIAYIGEDHAISATGNPLPSTPDYGWMVALGVTSPFQTLPYDGTGIGVAVIDSGIAAGAQDLQNATGQNRVVPRTSFRPLTAAK
jgi:hypothetical protein